MPRVADKYVDKLKRLRLTPDGRGEKNKKQKGPRVAKKRKKPATIYVVFIPKITLGYISTF